MKAPKLKSIPSKVVEKKSSTKENYSYNPQPSLSIDETILPEVKDWSVGKEYELIIKVKQTETRIEDYGPNKGKITARFNITKIGVTTTK